MTDTAATDAAQARTPDQWVKRAPSTSERLKSGAVTGATGTTVALIVYYIQQCVDAGRFVAPSNEMLIWLVGLAFPFAQGLYLVGKKNYDAWLASKGVET